MIQIQVGLCSESSESIICKAMLHKINENQENRAKRHNSLMLKVPRNAGRLLHRVARIKFNVNETANVKCNVQ